MTFLIIMLINVKMPTIMLIHVKMPTLTFISMTNATSESLKARKVYISVFSFYEQLKFRALNKGHYLELILGREFFSEFRLPGPFSHVTSLFFNINILCDQ